MTQTVTVKIKLLPTKQQAQILSEMSHDYIQTINTLVSEMVQEKKSTIKTSKDVRVNLPSAVKNQAIETQKVYSKKQRKRNSKPYLF